MVCYPEVQKKAQEELDKVLNGRLPEHSDIASLPYLSALIKEVYRYTAVSFENLFSRAKCISPSRWQPVAPLGRPSIFPSNIVTSRCPYLVKASRISRPPTISTITIISLLTLLWSPTNGDSHFQLLNIEHSLFLKLYTTTGRWWTMNETTQNHASSNPRAFWATENSTALLETRWTSHLDSAGGEHYLILATSLYLN